MKNQKGTSLVSVIVSFAVLMIVMLLLQVSITASGRYAARAEEIWEAAAEAENRYINSDDPANLDKQNNGANWAQMVALTMEGREGEEIWGGAGAVTIRKTAKGTSEESIQIYFIDNQ